MLKKLREKGCELSEEKLATASNLKSAISYTKAVEQNLLNDAELKRLAIVYLIHNDEIKPSKVWIFPNKLIHYHCANVVKVYYELAAKEAGTTAGSFPVLLRGNIKRLCDAGCCYTEDELENLEPPAKTPGTGPGRKKAVTKRSADSVDDDAEKTTPSKKSRGGGRKKAAPKTKVEEQQDSAAGVKVEAGMMDVKETDLEDSRFTELDDMEEV
jgi:hypothetical protein